jgi:predicted dehydrogenase
MSTALIVEFGQMPPAKTALIVGAGSIGERHIRCFLATGRVDVSFVELKESLRREIQGRYPQVKAFASLEAALREKVDVAVVATPASMHLGQAITLARLGVHLLIEKPLGVSFDGVEELRKVVRESRLTAAVAYVYRAHPVLAEMRQAIRSGRFGRPLELVFVAGQNFPFFRPAYRETYYVRRESGGGAVQDALTHGLDAGQWVVGSANRVVADMAHQVLAGVEVEDTVHVLARQRGQGGQEEVLASYCLNQHQAANELTLTVVCDRGVTRFEHHQCRWQSMEMPGGQWTDHESRPLERDELFVRQANGFLDAVEGAGAPLCSLEEGIAALRMNLAVLESAERGAWVDVEEN